MSRPHEPGNQGYRHDGLIRETGRRKAVGKRAKPKRWSYRPSFQDLEIRWLPSTFSVTNTNDSGAGSLRQAITDSNGTAGLNTIDFNIGAVGSQQTIAPL